MKKNNSPFFFSILLIFFNLPALRAQSVSLITPSNNFCNGNDSVLFSWNSISTALFYELDVAEDNTFTINAKKYFVYNAADTLISSIASCKTYFWRVRAFSPAASSYSPARSFSVFTPACFPNLELWLDASSGVTANGANEISEWKDRSGKNKNATQSISSSQGIKIKETQTTSNRSSFVRLDGVDDFFNIDSAANLNSFFSVYNWRGTAPKFSAYSTLIMSKVSKPRGFVLLGSPGSTNYYIDGAYNTFDPPQLEINAVTTTDMAPLTRLKMLNGIKTGAAIHFNDFFIGKFPGDASSFWNGDIGDLIIYSAALSKTEKEKVQKYLNDKYAPPVNLGPDKILCSFPYILKAKKEYYTSYKWQDASTADSIIINAPGTYFVTTANLFGTTSSDTVVIAQDVLSYTANLGNDICTDKPFTLNAGPAHLSYNWSTGSSSNKITISASGTYWVMLTDCKGNSSKDTINVTIHPLPVFNLGSDRSLCYYSKDTLDPGFINSLNYQFLWSDNSTDSVLFVNKNGNYAVRVTDKQGCAYRDTIRITVDSTLYPASLGADVAMCAGNFIYLKTGAAAVTGYIWSDASTNDSLEIAVTGQYAVTLSNSGKCSKKDTINVVISGHAPTANFIANTTCLSDATQFTDKSTFSAGETLNVWLWDFGDGTNSASQNPLHTYADSGSYQVRLTVKTVAGCISTVNKQVHVYPNPVADFSTGPLPCNSSLLQFNGKALSYGYPVTAWDWDFGDPASGSANLSVLKDPSHHFTANGTYATRLTIKNNMGCTGTVVKTVSAQQTLEPPQLLFPANAYNSPADSISFSWTATCGVINYELNIAEDINFTNNVKVYKVYNLSADTVLKGFSFCKTYYWRARAFTSSATAFSAPKSFSLFSPDCVTGLEMWLDASYGISKDGSNHISQWKDKSNHNRNAVQGSINEKPLFFKESASTTNKSSFVRLDGTDDFFNIDSSARVRSFYAVFNWRGSLPNFSGYNTLFMSKVSMPKGFVLLGTPNTTNYYMDGSNNTFTDSETEVNGNVTKSMAPLERLKIFGGITSLSVKLPDFFIGKFPNDPTSFWKGDIGDIIVYNTPLNQVQKDALQTFFNDKYAPGVNLGPDQTVCGFPFTIHARKNYFTDYVWQNASTADSLIVNAPGIYFVKTTNVFGRISADTIVIKQDAMGYAVNLGKDTAVCTGQSVRLIAGPSYLSYKWSTGSTASYIDIKTAGNYSVEMKDCSGKISRDTMNLIVHPLPTFSFGKDTMLCNGMNFKLDPGFLDSKKLTFTWSDNTHDSVHIANYSGVFSLKVKSEKGCVFSDTINVTIDSLIQLATLGPDTSFCAGNFIYLKKGAANAVSYLWSNGSTNDSIAITTTGMYWVQVKSINNCSTADTVSVNVAGVAPNVSFSATGGCLNKLISFTDLSTPAPGKTITSWSWDFGDSFSSTQQNPSHIFTDTSTYIVRLMVKTDDGCGAPFSKAIKVYPTPKPGFTLTNSCEKTNAKFTGAATTFGYPVTQWSWNFADPGSGSSNASSLQHPEHYFSNSGIYAITLSLKNSKGCSDTLVKNVVINQVPNTDFNFSVACKDDTVFFKDMTTLPSGTVNNGNYWSFGNGTSTLLNPVHVFPANVKYNVMHIVTASNGCKDTIVKSVDVHASPVARFTNSNSCELNPTLFTDQSFISAGSIKAWQWNFDGKGSSNAQNPQYNFTKSGNVIVKQVVISDVGCKDSLLKTIVVYPKPTAQFTATPNYGNPGQSVKFTNTSIGAATYSWNFNDGGTSILVNPTHIYADTGSYHPSLIATSTIGCMDTVKGSILILKRFMDVAITGATTEVQNGGGVLLNDYLSVRINLANKSTADVFALDLYMETNDGPAIKEAWSGKFLKGDKMIYDFKATPNLKSGGHFVCVYALNPNGLKDEVPIDNKLCKALDEHVFKVLDPYPNPTEDLLMIPLIIPNEGNLTMTIYDSKGKEVRKPYEGIIANGLQLIKIDTREFSSGLYLCKVQLEGETLLTKFIKK